MTSTKPCHFRLAFLSCFIAVCFSVEHAFAETTDSFNPALLEIDSPGASNIDLSVFEKGSQAPGIYRVDIALNGTSIDTQDLEFRASPDGSKLVPCLTKALLEKYNVRVSLFPALSENESCVNITAIPDATTDFNFNTQRLNISIPQAALKATSRGYVSPDKWDDGIKALILNYDLNGDYTHNKKSDSNSNGNNLYLNLRPGVNIGSWRLRNYTTWQHDKNGNNKWNTLYTYAQRNIKPIKSDLIIGESNSSTQIFDGIPFRGIQLRSDEEMLPDSLKGYAPIVRGVARTNAKVVIRQNNYVIYQTYVSPGAFIISDMYPTGGSGDLNVTVEESDGSQQHFVVPFATLPIFQREGQLKYNATVGQYRPSDGDIDKSVLLQATASYGLPWQFTVYGGTEYAKHYNSYAFGLGKNLGSFGAISADSIISNSELKNTDKKQGNMYRIRYSKNIAPLGTSFSASTSHYSENFHTMSEVLDTWSDKSLSTNFNRKKSRLEFLLSQRLYSNLGSLSLSYFDEHYWRGDKKSRTLNVAYNNNWKNINYSINAMHNETTSLYGEKDVDDMLYFNVSFSLDRWLSGSRLSYGVNLPKHGDASHSLTLSGTTLKDNNLNWNVRASHNKQNGKSNTDTGINLDYKGTYGASRLGYNHDKDSDSVNYSIEGGIVVHSEGVTFGQQLGETSALVKVPHVSGIRIQNGTGVKTDKRGYTIVPYMSPYRKNDVNLDVSSLADDVEVASTSKRVIPTRGAIVKANFDSRVGKRAIMTLLQKDGKPIPFGTTVKYTDSDFNDEAIVGDDGQAYITGLSNKGKLLASWGAGNNRKHCVINFDLSKVTQQNGLYFIDAKCE